MKFNHLDLQVDDVRSEVAFFEDLLDFEMQSNRASPAIAILSDRHGLTLVLQRKADPLEHYPDGFHIGFLLDDEAAVLEFHALAEKLGYRVSAPQRNHRGLMVYCTSPGNILVEVSVRRARLPPA